MKNVSKEDVMQGAATTIKDVKYLKTAEYVQPFLNKVEEKAYDISFAASEPKQNILVDGSVVTTYNRVHVIATLNSEYDTDEFKTIVGMIYGLDIRKPVAKFYKAYVNKETGDMYMFDDSAIDVQDLEEDTLPSYDIVDDLLENKDDVTDNVTSLRMNEISAERENVDALFGKWLHNVMTTSWNQGYGPIKLAISTITDMFKDMFINEKSADFVDESDVTTMLAVYKNLVHAISADGRDITNCVEKILLVRQILDV